MAVVSRQTVGITGSTLGSMAKGDLTPKQLHFARCVASGMTQADAYREAYDTEGSPATVHQSSSRLMKNPKISARVQVLIGARERAIAQSSLSDREKVLSKLREWMESASGEDSMKIRSAELLGRSVGLFKDVTVSESTDRTSAEVASELEQRLNQLVSGKPELDLDNTKPSDLLN